MKVMWMTVNGMRTAEVKEIVDGHYVLVELNDGKSMLLHQDGVMIIEE